MRRSTDLTRTQRWAWLIPVLVCAVDWRANLPFHVALSIGFFAGLAAGAVWQRLYRRDLVERFWGLCVLAVILMALAMLPGWGASTSSDFDADWLGVFVGLVLTEGWLRSRDGKAKVRFTEDELRELR